MQKALAAIKMVVSESPFRSAIAPLPPAFHRGPNLPHRTPQGTMKAPGTMAPLPTSDHPCLSRGACCASFRVDFSVEETQERVGTVPDGLAVSVTEMTRRMRGTDHARPRCAALTGTVG